MRVLSIALAAVVLAGSAAAETTVPPEARSHFDKAEIAREEGRLEEAATHYRKAIEIHPLYERAHAGYLAALRAAGEVASARSLYADLTAKHPESVELKAFFAAAREPAEAVAALDPLASEHSDNVRVLLELGRAQLLAGEDRDAERSLKRALRIQSDLPLAHVLIGDLHMRDEKYVYARKAYEDALEIDNAYIPARLRVALAWHRQGKPEEALEILGNLVSEQNLPRLVAGHWLLAIIRRDMGNIDDAVKSLDTVLSIAPDDFWALMAKGHLLLSQGKPVEATAVFEKAVTAHPRSSEAVFCLGWAYETSADAPEVQEAERKNRLAKAAETYERCATMDPGVRPRDSLGFVLLLVGRHGDAVTQFKRAKDIDPEYAPTLNNLGLASDMADNRAEAKRRYEAVLDKIDKHNVRAHVMLALDLWLDGSASKAIKELDRALKIDPEDDLAWTFLGDIQYDSQKVERAIRAYKKATEINDANFYAWYHMGIAYHDDKRRYEEAERCYEKAQQARLDPPVALFLRLAEVNDEDALDRPEKALQYYQHYVDSGGPVDGLFDWIPERINELKEELSK